MMDETKKIATMTLPSRTAVALWVTELAGQISDGMWENSGPRDHWKFWCNLTVVPGDVASLDTCGEWVRKNAYNFAGLYEYVGDRMLANARMAKAGADPTDRQLCETGQYMPPTLAEFHANKASGKWEYDFVNKYMDRVSDELAEAFYEATYTMKEMRADIKLIKATMKHARV